MREDILKQLEQASKRSGHHNGILNQKFKDIPLSKELIDTLEQLESEGLITKHPSAHGTINKIVL